MSHGFYITYTGRYPELSALKTFWTKAITDAGLTDDQPWKPMDGPVEHIASRDDLDVELAIFLDGDHPCEISIEGHWSSQTTPAAYRAILNAARELADQTNGRLENLDAGAPLEI